MKKIKFIGIDSGHRSEDGLSTLVRLANSKKYSFKMLEDFDSNSLLNTVYDQHIYIAYSKEKFSNKEAVKLFISESE